MKIRNLVNGVVDAGINITSAAAGGLVGAYCINHDIANDTDMSIVVGATAGVGTFCIANSGLKAVKNGTIGVASGIKTKLSRKSKQGATN